MWTAQEGSRAEEGSVHSNSGKEELSQPVFMFFASLLPEQLSLHVRFSLTKGFHGKKKLYDINNYILIRIANICGTCTLL